MESEFEFQFLETREQPVYFLLTFIVSARTIVVLVADLLVWNALAGCTLKLAVLPDAVRIDARRFAIGLVRTVCGGEGKERLMDMSSSSK